MSLGLALALVFALGWVPSYVCRAEAVSAALAVYSPVERLWVRLSVAALSVHMTVACMTVSLIPGLTPARAAVGLLVFVGGIGFWFWGRVLIGPLRVRRMPEEPPLQLRRDGAFGIVRHPLYCGVLIAASAPLFVAPRPHVAITFGFCCIVLAVRAVQEERRLQVQVGPSYMAYCREVKRLVPFVW